MSTIVLLNKPYGVLSQFTPEGRWRALDEFIPLKGVYVAGRLDADSEGLLILTGDGKLQALAAHGAPILCTAPGEAAEIVVSNGMGLSSPPGDPRALADTIQRASQLSTEELRQMGANGRAMYRTQMSRSIGAKKLARILEDAARTGTSRR